MPYFRGASEMVPVVTYMKSYRKDTFTLPGIGTVTQFAASTAANGLEGGPNDMFHQLQTTEGLGLRRYGLKQSVGKYTKNVLCFPFAFEKQHPLLHCLGILSVCRLLI